MLMARDAAQAHGSRDGDAARYTLHAIVHAGGAPMGTDQHARHRNRQNLQSPPGGRNDDDTHALQAGKDGATARKSVHGREPSTRDEGRDDRRSGSDSGRNR
jgi:hypothetical protein